MTDKVEWIGRDGEGDIQAYTEDTQHQTNLLTDDFFKSILCGDTSVRLESRYRWKPSTNYHIKECLLPWEFMK